MDEREFCWLEGMLFHRDEVQARGGRSGLAQGAPCRQKIEPGAESSFNDREAPGLLPALRQTVTVQKDMLRLLERPLRRRVDVFEARRIEGAVGAQGRRRRNDGLKIG